MTAMMSADRFVRQDIDAPQRVVEATRQLAICASDTNVVLAPIGNSLPAEPAGTKTVARRLIGAGCARQPRGRSNHRQPLHLARLARD